MSLLVEEDISRDFLRKVSSEMRVGLNRYGTGKVTPFAANDHAIFKGKLIVAAELDHDSTEEIEMRVCRPLAQIAESYGFQIQTPGNGLPPSHITLQTVQYGPDEDAQQKVSTLGQMLQRDAEQLEGVQLPLDTLLLSHAKLVVCLADIKRDSATSDAVVQVLYSRDAINRTITADNCANGSNGMLRTDRNFIHSSLGRISQLVSPISPGFALSAYATIGRSLHISPIQARIGRVQVGSGINYLNQPFKQ